MELWDLMDENRRLIGETLERGRELPQGRYHLVVHCILFNGNNEMLIQKRQPFKAGWPGLWDVTVGGSAVAGEDSRTAVTREVKEEIGLTHEFTGAPAMSVTFSEGFDDFWIVKRDDVDLSTLHLQESEVERVMWADRETIREMIDNRTFIPYEKGLIDLLFHLKDRRDLHTEE